jgi:uncharacterized protein YbjT (DUF2867 family)
MILIAGATGRLGGQVARALLDNGHRVRILARRGSAYASLEAGGAQVAFGDLRDPVSLAAACAGVDAVLTTANSARRSGADNIATVDDEGTAALIDAAGAAGVQHFTYVSVLGVTPESPVPFLAAKAANENRLRASGMRWTILAPNYFMESWPAVVVGAPAITGQPVYIVGEGRRRHAFVCEGDVAAFAVAAVSRPEAIDQHIPIGGPAALSWRDVVAVYERVLGKTLAVRSVADGEPLPGIPASVVPLLTAMDHYETAIDTTPWAQRLGVTLTSLEQVARQQVANAGRVH